MNKALPSAVFVAFCFFLVGSVPAQWATPFGTPSVLPPANTAHTAPAYQVPPQAVQPAGWAPAANWYAPASYYSAPGVPAGHRSPHAPMYVAAPPQQDLPVQAAPAPILAQPAQTPLAPQPDPGFTPMPEGTYGGCDGNGYGYGNGAYPQTYGSPGCAQDGMCGAAPQAADGWMCTPCGPCWYVGASALMITRNDNRFFQLSYDDTNLIGHVLATDTGLHHWDAGFEVAIGYFLTSDSALELSYWRLDSGSEQTNVFAAHMPGNLNTALDFSPLNIGTDNVNDLFDNAQLHRVTRDYQVDNVELNLISGEAFCCSAPAFRLSYLGGLRYMRFSEGFQYASADNVAMFGAHPATEAYYDISVENNLWGVQLGGRGDWFMTPAFSLYAATKFGIYSNWMDQHSSVHNAYGSAVVGPGNPLAGYIFDIGSDKTLASFVGELDLGLTYRFSPSWSAVLGYRALVVSGVAFATDQVPTHFADLPGVDDIDCNGHLILHGAHAGVTFSW